MNHHPRTRRRWRVTAKAAYSAMIRDARALAWRLKRKRPYIAKWVEENGE